MLAKTGLLIVSNPTQIAKILSSVKQKVKITLYIQLLSALGEPFGAFHPQIYSSWPKFSKTITKIYADAARDCGNLDVRVLLSGLKYSNIAAIKTLRPIDLVIFDKKYSQNDIDQFLKGRVHNINKCCDVVTIENGCFDDSNGANCVDERVYKHTVLGGTFDRLHTAHKMMLTEAALRATEKVTVGITDENLITGKILWELIEPMETRLDNVADFLQDICPELELEVVQIIDPFGPTQYDHAMDLIVVSSETLKGGLKVNEVRANNNLKPLEVVSIDLIDDPHVDPNEERKISSSNGRMRLLGTLLRPVEAKDIPNSPYVIGLTGGIASGKSSVAEQLQGLGAHVIDCDRLAHELYKPGTVCYNLIVEHFGTRVVAEDGEINRKELGAIIFSNPEERNTLNSLIWPAMAVEIKKIIACTDAKVVVVDAAVLLLANWQQFCHEIWTTFIPRSEAIIRLGNRNKLNEEQAMARIASQPNNSYYVEHAHVVLCSLWPVDYTRKQVEKAWQLLQLRLPLA